MSKRPSIVACVVYLALTSLFALACAPAQRSAVASQPAGAPEVIVLSRHDAAPPGSDAAPWETLAFRYADGAQRAIEGEALSHTAFRDGVALVDRARQLVLVSPDGSRRVLAQQAGASPVRNSLGALLYVARYGGVAEVHALSIEGRDRVIADGLSNAGLLTPLANNAVLFIGARNGGVAGMWLADDRGARCLSNCELKTGTGWDDHYAQPPGSAQALRDAFARLSHIDRDPDALGASR